MATVADLLAARTTAGSRYLAAITEFKTALTDLAGLDQALMHAGIAAQLAPAQYPVQTFDNALPQTLGQEFRHPLYATSVVQNLHDAITTARDGHIASVLGRV